MVGGSAFSKLHVDQSCSLDVGYMEFHQQECLTQTFLACRCVPSKSDMHVTSMKLVRRLVLLVCNAGMPYECLARNICSTYCVIYTSVVCVSCRTRSNIQRHLKMAQSGKSPQCAWHFTWVEFPKREQYLCSDTFSFAGRVE